MFRNIVHSLFFVMVMSLTVLAQIQSNANRQEQAGKTSIVIDRQLVRFLTAGEAKEWQLVVSNQQGEVIFDSRTVYGAALEWPLQNSQGEMVASGLYAYTLTTKAATDAVARTQRGHLIIDRASSADRVWVTSSPEVSLGSGSEAQKVTVVGGGEMTVGGAELPGSVLAGEHKNSQREKAATETAALVGTPNRIAKFAADGSTLIDSTLTETASGSVGVGTTNPAAQLTVQGSGDPLLLLNHTGTNGNPALWFQQDGATKAYMWWDRVNSHLNLGIPTRNPIMSLQDNGTVNIGGSVGIGNTPLLPFYKLQVRALSTHTGVFAESTGAGNGVHGQSLDGYGVRGTANGYGAGILGEAFGSGHAGVFQGKVFINGSLTVHSSVLPNVDNAAFTLGSATQRWKAVYAVNGAIQTSDARLKRDVTNLRYGLRELLQLRPVSFAWKDPSDQQQHLGLIAQETEEIIPEAVAREADPDITLGLNYSALIPVVIKAVQEQQSTITELKSENERLHQQNTTLQGQNADLDARLRRLEQRRPQLMLQPQGQTSKIKNPLHH